MPQDQPAPTLQDGRILFPRGTKPAVIRDQSCSGCFFGFECSGPQGGGGEDYADVSPRKTSNEEILGSASCLKEVEG